jgi:hypothetical protein
MHLPLYQLQFLRLQQINHNRDLPDVVLLRKSLKAVTHRSLPIQLQSGRRTSLPEGVAPCSDPLRRISQLEHTRTSQRASTNAPSAQTRSVGTLRYGRVGHVGQSSISVASRNGPRMKGPQYNDNPTTTAHCLDRSNGGALAAICPKTYCQRHILAGARKSWILTLSAEFLHIHVVKHAAESGRSPKIALTDAI